MTFEVRIPSLNGVARVEIKTVQEEERWTAYVSFASGRAANETCLLLGQSGIPYRFGAATEKKAEDAAKKFLEQHYEVVRMIW